MIAIVLAIIAAVLAVVLSKSDPSPPSPPSPVVPEVPSPPTELTRNDKLTSQTQVSFTWAAPENDGGEPVEDYTVSLKNADGFDDIASGLTTKSYTLTPATSGETYSFRV